MTRYLNRLRLQLLCYKRDETAATAIEYGLLVAFISIFIIGAVLAIGGSLDGFFIELESLISSVY
ncbi:MAG: Flp family type IVb pilin [Alphaproteobacteria bacterium]|nr:Flp family type IVb pilin [Alphaproteobacteria bacterium]